ncbi:unnamed protein product, partial [Onchocerca flexuosa]|uniref:S1 motif domain-containing protein n=1 Tax=Onchocerca flexuosa TaxID=387005 RepID=A0A183HB36_9BILA
MHIKDHVLTRENPSSDTQKSTPNSSTMNAVHRDKDLTHYCYILTRYLVFVLGVWKSKSFLCGYFKDILNMEIDFPREDLSISRKRRGTFSDNNETTDVQQRPIKKESKFEFDGVWNQRITSDFLTEGMLGLGVITKIKEAEILLECSDGVIVKVPVQNFGSLILETLQSSSSLTLEDVFRIGQMLAFKVLKAGEIHETERKRKKVSYPIVSCDPLTVNFHLNPGSLSNGLVLNGIVESVEDK